MSRINELKKQYPELNITMFDLMVRLDTTKTHKYLPLMCKIFGKRFDVKEMWRKDELSIGILELQSNLINKGISTDGLTDNQMFYLSNYITENFTTETYHTLNLFMEYMDKNMIEKNDVTSYKDIDDIRGAVTLATMKELTKELEGQVIKEYEDEKWVVVRPLTFSASAKYGSSTRWCTTYQKEKNYFEKYWRRGILAYFINKETGYKFAGYKGLDGDSEFSFWNAEDSRVDYLDVDADDYLYPIVKKIFRSEFTNKNLCSDEIQQQVYTECISVHEKMRVEFSDETIPLDEQPTEVSMEQPELPVHNYQREMDTIRELINDMGMTMTEEDIVPTMRA
jgi:hypothetical protein